MKQLVPLIAILALAKFILANHIDLGYDEAYYYTYVKKLQWSYFDHPMMVALMGYLSTLGLKFPSEFFLRLFPLLFGIINPILVYQITKEVGTEKMAKIASLLYLATLYGSLISGLFLLPDAPLAFFALCNIYFSVKYIQKNQVQNLYWAAIFLALALTSKYQAIFMGLGLAMYIIKYQKNWFKNPHNYLSLLIALMGFLPTLIWNVQHQWDSFEFHSNRIGNAFLMKYLPKEIFGNMIYQNPIVFALIIYAVIQRKKWQSKLSNDKRFYLLAISLPLIFSTLLFSIFGETLPHWSGIAYIGLIIWSSDILSNYKRSYKWGYAANTFLLMAVLFAFEEVKLGLLSNERIKNQVLTKKGYYDPTQDVYGWNQLATQFDSLKKQNHWNSNLLITHRWYPAGSLDYYLARPLNMQVIGIGPKSLTHQYSFKDNDYWLQKNDNKGYFIAQSNNSFRPETLDFKDYTIFPLDTIYITRRNDTVRVHFVYLMELKNE